jgi:hypothetical protein
MHDHERVCHQGDHRLPSLGIDHHGRHRDTFPFWNRRQSKLLHESFSFSSSLVGERLSLVIAASGGAKSN